MATQTRVGEAPEDTLQFEGTASLLKALAHPLRLRLACGLCCEPSNLTRISAALSAPLSTVALHLGVLRRAGILDEERSGAEVVFRMRDDRVRRVLHVFCRTSANKPPLSWGWDHLARGLREPRG